MYDTYDYDVRSGVQPFGQSGRNYIHMPSFSERWPGGQGGGDRDETHRKSGSEAASALVRVVLRHSLYDAACRSYLARDLGCIGASVLAL